MNVPDPKQSRFEIRGRLCGIPLKIQPLFWSAAAVLGIRYYADPEAGSLGYFSFWIGAVLGCVLFHSLCQAWVALLLGIRCEILLHGLGSQILGVEKLSRCWQRVLVLAAGPIGQLLLLGCMWGLTAIPFPETFRDWGWQTPILNGTVILVRITLAWGLLNIVPLWPLTGGRMALDAGESLLGGKGRTAATLLSMTTTTILTVWVVFEMSRHLNSPFDARYTLYLIEGIINLFFCFILWIQNFKALLPTASDDDQFKEIKEK